MVPVGVSPAPGYGQHQNVQAPTVGFCRHAALLGFARHFCISNVLFVFLCTALVPVVSPHVLLRVVSIGARAICIDGLPCPKCPLEIASGVLACAGLGLAQIRFTCIAASASHGRSWKRDGCCGPRRHEWLALCRPTAKTNSSVCVRVYHDQLRWGHRVTQKASETAVRYPDAWLFTRTMVGEHVRCTWAGGG